MLHPKTKVRIISDKDKYETIKTDPAQIRIFGHIDTYIESSQGNTSLRVVIRQEAPPDQTSIFTRAQRPNQLIMVLGGREHTTKRVRRPRCKASSHVLIRMGKTHPKMPYNIYAW